MNRIATKNGRIIVDEKLTNFWVSEWVSKKVYQWHGDNCVHFLEPDTINMIQFLRTWLGTPLTMNNWWEGGYLNQRGYRSDWTTVGAKRSQHRYRLAGDISSTKISADRIRRVIFDYEDDFFNAGVRRVEDGAYSPTWVHIDRKRTDWVHKIELIKPNRSNIARQEILHTNQVKSTWTPYQRKSN